MPHLYRFIGGDILGQKSRVHACHATNHPKHEEPLNEKRARDLRLDVGGHICRIYKCISYTCVEVMVFRKGRWNREEPFAHCVYVCVCAYSSDMQEESANKSVTNQRVREQ